MSRERVALLERAYDAGWASGANFWALPPLDQVTEDEQVALFIRLGRLDGMIHASAQVSGTAGWQRDDEMTAAKLREEWELT